MKSQMFAATAASLLVLGLAATGPAFAQQAVGGKIEDAELIAKIKTNLLRSPEVEGLDVHVDAKNGVVTLSGTAATTAERASAERIAKTSDGVTKVENRIVLKTDGAADKPAVPPSATPSGTTTTGSPAPGTAPPPPAN
jgi:hyperosmotically inducible protein